MEFNFKTGAKEGYPGEEKNLPGYTAEFRIVVEQRAPGKGKAPSGRENRASKPTHLGFPGEK